MNWIDLLLIAIIAFSAWSGWNRGFIMGLADLITWVGSLFAGFFLYSYTAVLLQLIFHSLGAWLQPLAFLLTILIARVLLAFVLNKLIGNLSGKIHHNQVNRILGVIPGLINGLLNAALAAVLLLVLPLHDTVTNQARESKTVSFLTPGIEWVQLKLVPVFDKAIQQTMTRLTVEPGSTQTVKLPYKVQDAKPRPDLEAQMLLLVNKERLKAGLKPLKADPQLTPVARAHSADMFARGYFSHYTPEQKTPFDRLREAKISFLAAGENLAFAKTLSIAHEGLMNSPGHRANILNPAFGRLGIGILDGGFYGLMISQEFRNP